MINRDLCLRALFKRIFSPKIFWDFFQVCQGNLGNQGNINHHESIYWNFIYSLKNILQSWGPGASGIFLSVAQVMMFPEWWLGMTEGLPGGSHSKLALLIRSDRISVHQRNYVYVCLSVHLSPNMTRYIPSLLDPPKLTEVSRSEPMWIHSCKFR